MNSKILEQLLFNYEKNGEENRNAELYKMINEIVTSSQFHLFEDVMSNVKNDFLVNDNLHGISHNERVALLTMAIATKEKLSDYNLNLLLKAALYHDIGRSAGKGREHGELSAKILEENKDVLVPELDEKDINIVKFLCEIHSSPDEEVMDIAKKYSLEVSDELRKIANILKDADALDRVRLPRFGKLNTDYLRTQSAKEMVDNAKNLFREYLDIQYDLGITFDTSVFDIKNSNALEDEEKYYIFRTLNDDNISDIGDLDREIIRTKGQVARDKGENTRYADDTKVSLEEVFANVRVSRFGKDNNCISFSSNTNVNLDYENESFIMYAIPKNGESATFSAGKYMLEEINKKISQKIRTTNINQEIIDIISQIDSETESDKVKSLVGESIERFHPVSIDKNFTGLKKNRITKESLVARFEKKQFFNEQQQLEYNKVIAKLTVLEVNGILRSVLKTQTDNSRLIATLGVAFSSSEFIHYGDIPKDKISVVSKSNLELLSILQQAETIENIDKTSLNILIQQVLKNIKDGKDLLPNDNISQNDIERITNNNLEEIIPYLTNENESGNIIPYFKGNRAIEYIQEYAKAKVRTKEIIDTFKSNIPDVENKKQLESVIDYIENKVIIPNSNIVSRRNNSGIQISESVNLDMNNNRESKMFSEEEHRKLISSLNNLTNSELKQIAGGDFSVLKNKNIITQSLTSKKYLNNTNDYYIDYIIDSVSLEEIYFAGNERTEKNSELRNKIAEKLKQVNVNKLLKGIVQAGVDYKDAPNCIVNIVLENGIGENVSFEQLSKIENVNEVIAQNISRIHSRINPYMIDRFLDVLDNNNKVENTEIFLRDYQQKAVDGVEEIFKTKKFAGVVLPTGAGKSFVAMTEMMNHTKEPILYFAPQEEILNQVKKHILKHILEKTVLTLEDAVLMLEMNDETRRDFLKSKVYNKSINISDTISKIKIAKTEEEKINIMSQMLPRSTNTNDDIMDAIKTIFPNLEMYCYQSLNSNNQYNSILKKDAGLIIWDEMHRTGAETWEPLIEGVINKNLNAKNLGITATPVRDDGERTDMMKKMAEKYGGYTEEELINKDYLAEEMYLIDAMQNKYVIEPKIVSFNFSLGETEEYKFITEMIKEEKKKNPNSQLAKDLLEIKSGMDEIINNRRDGIKNNVAGMMKVIEENIPENLKNGRFIVFLEQKPRDYKGTSEEYVEEQIKLVNKYFAGVNNNINSGFLLSNRKDKSKNGEAIQNFENLTNEQLKLLYAVNMLNEGVHVENINGELMLRPIGSGSNILYFQQIGRVIYGIEPNNPPSPDSVPIIFDVYNNFLTRDLDRRANMTTPTSDLNNLQIAANWINKHDRTPDINSENHDEARIAINIKKMQEKYEKYIDGINNSNLSETEIREVKRIIEIMKEYDFFDLIIPERIVPPGERELGRVNAFEIKGEVKRFMDLFKESKKAIKKAEKNSKTNTKSGEILRIRNTMSVLETLSEYGMELSDEDFIQLYKKINNIQEKDNTEDEEEQEKRRQEMKINAKAKLTLLQLINDSFTDGIRDRIIKELNMDEEELQDFEIYNEFDYARMAFGSSDKKAQKIFSIYDIREIRKCGILKENGKYIKIINSRGFVSNNHGPEIFQGINIFTGTNYDEEGYNIDGYDNDGYDREGFNKFRVDRLGFYKGYDNNKYGFRRDGYNEKTNSYFDEHGFDIEGIYWGPNPEFTDDFSKRINTYKKINEYGFDRDGDWYKEDENGNLIYEGKKDELGFVAFEETNAYGFRRDGINIETGELWDKHGFLINKMHKDTEEGLDKYDFNIDGYYMNTRSKLDNRNFDIDHFFHMGEGRWKYNTYSYYDENGRDIDGWDINGVDENGVEHFRVPVNERGFNQKKMHVITKKIFDENELDYDGYRWIKKGNEYIKTDSIYGKDLFSVEGLDEEGYRRDGINIYTNSPANKDGFDKEGYFWRKGHDGKYVKTDSKYGDDGYNKEGYNRYNFDRNHMILIQLDHYEKVYDIKEGREIVSNAYYSYTNENGFNYKGIHKNGTLYDDNGFDIEGLHKDTGEVVNKNQFDRDLKFCEKNSEGKWISTGVKYNDEGLDILGNYHEISKLGYRKGRTSGVYGDDGYNLEGYDQEGYDRKGYNLNGINKRGFNKEHLYVNKDGRMSIVNPRGFGYDGYIYEYDKKTGEYIKTEELYDDEGYDIDELNVDKFDKDFKYMHKSTTNDYGFNHFHRWKDGSEYDNHGFDFYGIHKETGKKYDNHYFDRDGYLYVHNKKTGQYIKTENKINEENFDIDGYYYEQLYDYNNQRLSKNKLQKFGIMEDTWSNNYRKIFRKKTNEKTDPMGRDIDGEFHIDKIRDCAALHDIKEREKEKIDEQKKQEYLKKQEEKRLEKRKQRKEFERQVELKKQEELKIKQEDFESKFDEDGICKSTNLPYDENFFDKYQNNVVTGRVVNSRGFNCFGECIRNEGKKYDRNNFKIDGTHYLTGEKYYEGYNAYAVDKNGKTREGKTHQDIIIARTYIKECLNGTSKKQFITKYSNRLDVYITRNKALTENEIKSAMRSLKIKIFDAVEMYPPFKEELQNMIEKTKNQIRARTTRYIMLRKNSTQNKEEIEKLQKEIAILKDRLDSVSMGEK